MSIKIKSVDTNNSRNNSETHTIRINIDTNGVVNHTLNLFQDNSKVWHPSLSIDITNCNDSNSIKLRFNIAEILHNLADILTSEDANKIDTLINMIN